MAKNLYKNKFNFRKIDSNTSIPWFTLPCVKFLNLILKKNYQVFEYGSGASTFYFAMKCRHVYSVEYYKEFYKKIIQKEKKNIKFIHHDYSGYIPDSKAIKNIKLAISKVKDVKYSEKKFNFLFKHGFISNTKSGIKYASQILKFSNNYFDVIVVDGQAREICLRLCLKKLKKKGFLIIDNSDRIEYMKQYELLIRKKFFRIDFWGLSNYNDYESCTSIFFKDIVFLKHYNLELLKKYRPFIREN